MRATAACRELHVYIGDAARRYLVVGLGTTQSSPGRESMRESLAEAFQGVRGEPPEEDDVLVSYLC